LHRSRWNKEWLKQELPDGEKWKNWYRDCEQTKRNPGFESQTRDWFPTTVEDCDKPQTQRENLGNMDGDGRFYERRGV